MLIMEQCTDTSDGCIMALTENESSWEKGRAELLRRRVLSFTMIRPQDTFSFVETALFIHLDAL